MFLELFHLFDRVNTMTTDDPAMQETAILLI